MALHAHVDTSLGKVTLVARKNQIVGLYFPQHRYMPAMEQLGPEVPLEEEPVLNLAAAELNEYLAGKRQEFTIPLSTSGNAFQEQVWALLQEIPYGKTTTYGAIAAQLGNKSLAQQVGWAIGRNPISIFIPCHRVLGADGKLTGYAGGVDRKQALLELEEPQEVSSGRLF